MSRLKLERPIVFFDLETTGTNVSRDRIVEIALLKVHPDGSTLSYRTLVNPECPIPKEATAIHQISDEDVKNAPTFSQVALTIADFLKECDLGGYNCLKFDIPMLAEAFLSHNIQIDFRSREIVDVQVIFHKMEQRTLSAAYRFYCGKELEDAHTAEADTNATYEVLLGQLDRYPDLPDTMPELDAFTHQKRNVDFAGRFVYDESGVERFSFGKYNGLSVVEVLRRDPSYFRWMMESDFSKDTKICLQKLKVKADAR